MTTDKPRIQVTLDEQTNGLLSLLADRKDQSRSAVAADLIQQALELQEDLYLSGVAEKRDRKGATWVDHKDVWK